MKVNPNEVAHGEVLEMVTEFIKGGLDRVTNRAANLSVELVRKEAALQELSAQVVLLNTQLNEAEVEKTRLFDELKEANDIIARTSVEKPTRSRRKA